MIVSIHQPAYLPWLGYFNRIVKSDIFVVLDHVQFEKNSFINRNKIVCNKKPLWLTVPVLYDKSIYELNINEVKINYSKNWKNKHYKSIVQSYFKSPCFNQISNEMEDLYKGVGENLNAFLGRMLKVFLTYLNINTQIVYSSDLDLKERKENLVLEICKKYNASTYLSGPHGESYLDFNAFNQENIYINIDNYEHPIYSQNTDKFIPNMSIIDLISHYGHDSLDILCT